MRRLWFIRSLGRDCWRVAYQAYLMHELAKRGLRVEAQVAVPIVYDALQLLDVGYRIDILVEGELVLELKAIEAIAPVHKAQLLTYLRHSKRRLGPLINFNVERLKDGICRQINGY